MPTDKWSKKRERQYEHIKESELEKGRGKERAKEIAARTVNKQRQQAGESEKKTSSGTGNPNKSLEERTVQELRNRAAELDIKGRSSMKKDQLIDAIRNRS